MELFIIAKLKIIVYLVMDRFFIRMEQNILEIFRMVKSMAKAR